MNEANARRTIIAVSALAATLACGSAGDGQVLYQPWIGGPGPRQPGFLAFSNQYDGRGELPVGAPDFPWLLSQTGAFADVEALEPTSGILPYEVQVPLWSDGASKRRWISVPDGATVGYSDDQLQFPAGTVFMKHFEMALDERFPDERRRLETRFWITVRPDAQYGVTYKWNAEQTDAELLLTGETEDLVITGADGEQRTQPYYYPASNCQSCHNAASGFVLGARTPQLNRSVRYRLDRPPIDQLAAWSERDLFDRRIDSIGSAEAPRLAAIGDEEASLEERVLAYWDGNCSMCHAGSAGVVPGWDARQSATFDARGLAKPPNDPSSSASRLIEPGVPEQSLIYMRGDTTESPLRMPPVGRNRVDEAYIDVLGRWIASLEPTP